MALQEVFFAGSGDCTTQVYQMAESWQNGTYATSYTAESSGKYMICFSCATAGSSQISDSAISAAAYIHVNDALINPDYRISSHGANGSYHTTCQESVYILSLNAGDVIKMYKSSMIFASEKMIFKL